MTSYNAVKKTYPFWVSVNDGQLSNAKNIDIRIKIYDSDNNELFFELPFTVAGDRIMIYPNRIYYPLTNLTFWDS